MSELRVVDNDKDEITVMNGDEEVRGWSYENDLERRAKMLCAREYVEGYYQASTSERYALGAKALSYGWDAEALQDIKRMLPEDLYGPEGLCTHGPLSKVMFRAGLLACREYMARFVEQGGDATTAASIRANWWPSLGADPGAPRKLDFNELADEVEVDGEVSYKSKPIDPSVEALPYALGFIG